VGYSPKTISTKTAIKKINSSIISAQRSLHYKSKKLFILSKVFVRWMGISQLILAIHSLKPSGGFPSEIIQLGFPYRNVVVALPLCGEMFFT
jgi:hypothetical protein